MTRTYEYRCLPKRSQDRYLGWCLEQCRQVYNGALSERKDVYERTGLSLTYQDQCRMLTKARERHEDWAKMFVQFQRGALISLHRAFQGFFARVERQDAKVGFPRFKGKGRVRSLYLDKGGRYTQRNGKWHTLKVSGMETKIPVYHHRPLPEGQLLLRRLVKDYKGWKVQMVMDLPTPQPIPVNDAIGIDVGLRHFYTDSNGATAPNPRYLQKQLKKDLLRELLRLSILDEPAAPQWRVAASASAMRLSV